MKGINSETDVQNVLKYGSNYNEKIITILTSVELSGLTNESVKQMFKVAYAHLIQIEDYERCAVIKKVEENYNIQIK